MIESAPQIPGSPVTPIKEKNLKGIFPVWNLGLFLFCICEIL